MTLGDKCFVISLETAFFSPYRNKVYQHFPISFRYYKDYIKGIVLTIAPFIDPVS